MQSKPTISKNKPTYRVNPGAKLKRDKARNALRDSQIGLDIMVVQLGKFLDEFAMVKTDREKAEILNRCIYYLSHNCMGSLNLSQLADCQCELLSLGRE